MTQKYNLRDVLEFYEQNELNEIFSSEPNDKLKMLSETLMKLRGQLIDKDDEILQLKDLNKQMEMRLNPTGAVYLKGSNINENI